MVKDPQELKEKIAQLIVSYCVADLHWDQTARLFKYNETTTLQRPGLEKMLQLGVECISFKVNEKFVNIFKCYAVEKSNDAGEYRRVPKKNGASSPYLYLIARYSGEGYHEQRRCMAEKFDLFCGATANRVAGEIFSEQVLSHCGPNPNDTLTLINCSILKWYFNSAALHLEYNTLGLGESILDKFVQVGERRVVKNKKVEVPQYKYLRGESRIESSKKYLYSQISIKIPNSNISNWFQIGVT